MSDLTLYEQQKEFALTIATELTERDEVIAVQAKRITELEAQLDSATKINKVLLDRLSEVANENYQLHKPREYLIGQRVECRYGSHYHGGTWMQGVVLNIGKSGVKIRYDEHYQWSDKPHSYVKWFKPEFVRPVEDDAAPVIG